MSENLIIEIFKKSNLGLGLNTTDIKNYKEKVANNISRYFDLTLQEIYPNNDWLQMPSNAGMNKLINLTDYSKNVYLPYKYDNLYLISFKCLKTKEIGYTWSYNYNNLLHPFYITNHQFTIIDVDSNGVNYKCKKCNIDGFKKKGAKNNEIVVRGNNFIYSCNEMIIKNIIE